MRVEVLASAPGELLVAFDCAELGVAADGAAGELEARLAEKAGLFADAALAAATAAPEPSPPRSVDAVTVRLVRVLVCAEVTVPLKQAREVWV